MPHIFYNGQQYDNIAQMPPEVREAYESAIKTMGNIFADNDKNGMPDILENSGGNSNIQTTYQVEINGQVYKDSEELPANLQPVFEQLAKQSENYIPEWINESGGPSIATVVESPPEWTKQQSSVKNKSEPVIEPVDGKPVQLLILLTLGAILIIALVIMALLLFK